MHLELIQKMDEATMALIFFTKDITENQEPSQNHFSRPNIYFEYGYLLSHIKKFGNPIERITLFTEEGLSVATDFQDIGKYEYSKKELMNYMVVVERILNVNKTLTEKTAKEVVSNCIARLDKFFLEERISERDFPNKSFREYKNLVNGKFMNTVAKRFPQSTNT